MNMSELHFAISCMHLKIFFHFFSKFRDNFLIDPFDKVTFGYFQDIHELPLSVFDVIVPLVLQFLEMFLDFNPLSIFDLIYSFLVSTECGSLVFDFLYDVSIDVFVVVIDAAVHVLAFGFDLRVEVIH